MNRRKFLQLTAASGLGVQCFSNQSLWPEADGNLPSSKILGMYVHEGWPYHHPYAARTWTVDDWRGYADGLTKLGFNTIIIWPAIETMPDPLTPSDRAHLERTAQVVSMLRHEFHLRVYITLCPNVVCYQQVADKYTFESRPLFASTILLNPADATAVRRMIELREKQLRPMPEMDGLVLIDSDPSGYPGSTNAQFANLCLSTARCSTECVRASNWFIGCMWGGRHILCLRRRKISLGNASRSRRSPDQAQEAPIATLANYDSHPESSAKWN